jgi:uncharacterized protein (DUF1330 family)
MTRDVIATMRPDIHAGPMSTAYALAHLRTPTLNDDVVEYLERIQDTMDPFGGRFAVHVPNLEIREGQWPGTLVILTFPSIDDARGWYDSPAYQEILHLRTDHIEGTTLLVEGVPDDYDVRHTAETFRRSLASAG